MKKLSLLILVIFVVSCHQKSYSDKVIDWTFYINDTMKKKYDDIDKKYDNTTDVEGKLNDLVEAGCDCLSHFDLSSLDNEEEVIEDSRQLTLDLLNEMTEEGKTPDVMNDERMETFILIGSARECFYEAGRRGVKKISGIQVSTDEKPIRIVMEKKCPEGIKLHDKIVRLYNAIN